MAPQCRFDPVITAPSKNKNSNLCEPYKLTFSKDLYKSESRLPTSLPLKKKEVTFSKDLYKSESLLPTSLPLKKKRWKKFIWPVECSLVIIKAVIHTSFRQELSYLELPTEHSSWVNITRVWFNGFIVPKDLSSGGSWHGCHQQTVPYTISVTEYKRFVSHS